MAKRSEELNRQLLRLAEALTKPTMIMPRESPEELVNSAEPQAAGQSPQDTGILAEVKEFLDGPQSGPGLAWQDPRD